MDTDPCSRAKPSDDGSEPMLQDFCFAANVGCQETAKNLQQSLGFGTGFLVASEEAVRACSKNESF